MGPDTLPSRAVVGARERLRRAARNSAGILRSSWAMFGRDTRQSVGFMRRVPPTMEERMPAGRERRRCMAAMASGESTRSSRELESSSGPRQRGASCPCCCEAGSMVEAEMTDTGWFGLSIGRSFGSVPAVPFPFAPMPSLLLLPAAAEVAAGEAATAAPVLLPSVSAGRFPDCSSRAP